MKRWTSNWAALALGAALMTAPAVAAAQTPAAGSAQETRQAAPAAGETQADPRQHLAAAEAALGRISSTAVTGEAQARIGELRSHVANLRDSLTETGAPAGEQSWSKEVAEIDRIVAALLSESPTTGTSGTTEPAPTGTAGSVTANKADAAVALDTETRARLTEVRDAVTAFATAMNRAHGTGAAGDTGATSTPSPNRTDAGAEASPSTMSTPPAREPAAQPPASTPPAAEPVTQPPASTPASTPAAAEPAAQPPAPGTQPADPAPASADASASKQALTAARDTLAELTKLPAASQLAGESRTQVQQLISDFNELITTSSNWRTAYAKVNDTLTSLIGAQTADESPAAQAAGNAGAVGTAGTANASLDPSIEAKLVEFRTHLKAFERAAGGATPASAASMPASTPMTATPAAPASTAAPGGTAAAPAEPTDPEAARAHAQARSHLEAIETILNGAGATTLTTTQVDELKTHVTELKKLLNER